jgi:DNA recombination protein RmuC
MQSLWIIVGLLIGGLAVFFLVRPRLKNAEAKAAEEHNRAKELDASRQKLEIELASLREIAGRVDGLTAQAEADRATILALTEKHSTSAASVVDRDTAISELKEQVATLSQQIAETREKLNESEVARATMQSTISEREAALKEERQQFTETKAAFRAQFAELSAEALKDNGEKFLETAKRVLALQHQSAEGDLSKRQEEIKNLVKPIEDGIKAVNDAAREMETTRATAFGTIEEQLKNSVASGAEVARQAAALKDALKRPNVRGRWGEVQLKICVELAGMEEHCDVEFQETSLSAEDEALRPDMIVRMPGGRKITVDSKTPMIHFLSYIEASTDEERQLALVSHGRAVKKHVGDLAKTDYMQKIAESPDFVVMFLPNESFLAMALEKEPTLMEDALRKKVLVATPGTLIGLLKVVQYGWNEQRAAQNAKLIAEEGSKLNGEIVKFLADFAKLSLALDTVNDAFGNSKRRVENQIAKRSLNLTALNARSLAPPIKGKKLRGEVANILKSAGADDEVIEQTEGTDSLALAAVEEDDDEG